jgi:thiamine pyrophosphate-dependent acetolactate synthase large subunit-like protein
MAAVYKQMNLCGCDICKENHEQIIRTIIKNIAEQIEEQKEGFSQRYKYIRTDELYESLKKIKDKSEIVDDVAFLNDLIYKFLDDYKTQHNITSADLSAKLICTFDSFMRTIGLKG